MSRSRERRPRELDTSDAPCAGKVAFRSEAHALRTMTNCREMCQDSGVGYWPIRAYSCPHCAMWHLTSKPLRPIPGQRS